jgi:hypothetical protein
MLEWLAEVRPVIWLKENVCKYFIMLFLYKIFKYYLTISFIMSENRISQMTAVQVEALELFKRKNADYGDAFATYGTVGVIVRMGDKMQRLISVSNKGVSLVDTESLRDTLIDLYNYAAMGVMLIDEKREEK